MCVICVQMLALDLKTLEDPSISEKRRNQLKRLVEDWKDLIQRYQERKYTLQGAWVMLI